MLQQNNHQIGQQQQHNCRNRISDSVECVFVADRVESRTAPTSPENLQQFDQWDDSLSSLSMDFYSLAGYLYIKFLGGALTLLRMKKKFYFVLDEANVRLAYFKDESEFIRKRQPAGCIELQNCVVTISESKQRAFVLHSIGGRQYELEAESDQCALAWLHCLQNRGSDASLSSLNYKCHSGSSQSLPYHLPLCPGDNDGRRQSLSNKVSILQFRSENEAKKAINNNNNNIGMSAASLPSDADIAAALDSALKCWVDRSANSTIALNDNNDQPVKKLSDCSTKSVGFYLDNNSAKSDDSEGIVIMSNGEVKSDEFADIQNHVGDEDKSKISDNAKSLHNWIKDWLRDQSQGQMENGEVESTSPTHDEPINNNSNISADMQSVPSDKQTLASEKEQQLYRTKERRFKLQIQQLNMRIKDLQRQLEQTQRYVHQAPELHVKFLQHQNKFLNAEILRLSTRWQGEQGQFVKLTSKITTLTNDLDKFKMDYVSLLQSCVRVALGERQREGTEVKLYGGDTHKIRIHHLIDEARQTDPSLPVLENLMSGNGHVDIYGFRHSFTNENLAIHYMSTQLNQHYIAQTSYQNRHRWKLHLNRVRRGLANTKETRALTRAGVPTPYRSSIWRCLVHQKISDLKFQHGKYYFKNLCSSHGQSHDLENSSLNQKQITLDLMRTMPNNVHFANSTCKGISQLQQVLHAFCIHNSNIGYCQGMNFLTAVCLLFLSPEDTFWFLIALTERYFLPSYFDQTLTGVQADQEVLKWLVEQKLPALAHHLQLCDIDLATITLNWFLALFFDSLPFETMLRVWDCFLLEGPKVLFRFALALLSMHQDALLEKSDTMSVLKVLKIATKYTYDVEGLTKIAFEGLKPFPRRQELLGHQTTYIKLLKERLRQKEEFKAAALGNAPFGDLMQIGASIWLPDENYCVLTFGHQNNGRIGVIQKGSKILRIFDVQFNCRILSIVASGKVLFVSLISGILAAVKFDCDLMQSKNLWEIRLADMALQLRSVDDNRLLAALANGSLAVLENCTSGTPNTLELYYIPVGPAPISCVGADGDGQLWCGMGCKVFVFNEMTLDCIEKLVVANSINGNCAAIFDRLVGFYSSDRGMWLAVANSSLLQLWDTHHFTCKLLYDVSKDCAGAYKKADDTSEAHITSLLNCGDTVWIGTANGYMLMYQINENQPLKLSKMSPCASLRNSMRRKEAACAKRGRSPIAASAAGQSLATVSSNRNLSSSMKEVDDESHDVVKKLPLTNRDSGYSTTSSSNNSNGNVSCVKRLSQSIPNFDFASLAKRWQSCDSLTVPPSTLVGQKRTQIPVENNLSNDPEHALDSPRKLRTPVDSVGLPRRYVKHAPAASSKPFNETVVRRRKSVGAISAPPTSLLSTDVDGDEGDDDVISPSQNSEFFKSRRDRQRSSSVLLSNTQSPSLEFDDFYFLYAEDDKSNGKHAGGLCTSRLNNTDSDWSIADANAAAVLLPWREEADDRSYAAEKFVCNYGAFNKRPSTFELRRKDLQQDEMFSLERTTSVDDPSATANCFASSETSSVISCASSTVESPFVHSLHLQMRLKISDKPVNSLTLCGEQGDKQTIISCAGSFGDNESILIWSPEENKVLWVNEPAIIETPGRPKQNKLQTRRKTLAWFRS